MLYNRPPVTFNTLSGSFFFFVTLCFVIHIYPYIEIEKVIAVRNYNARLAKIFEIEEYIMGMTINMTDFQL